MRLPWVNGGIPGRSVGLFSGGSAPAAPQRTARPRSRHHLRVPHRARPRRREGRYEESVAAVDPVPPPAARPARADRQPRRRDWEGMRRTNGAPPEPDLAGLRDRAVLLVGVLGRDARSELAALTIDQISAHARGLVVLLPRSKTNQRGEEAELSFSGTRTVALAARSRPCAPGSRPPRSPTARPLEDQQEKAGTRPASAPRVGQLPDPGRRHPRRPDRWPVVRAHPARRLRHLRPPARRLRPPHCPPDPPPVAREAGGVRAARDRLRRVLLSRAACRSTNRHSVTTSAGSDSCVASR
jgi:hypothetical protein